MKGEFCVSLTVKTSEFEPDQISAMMGVVPSGTRRIGDEHAHSKRRYSENLWIYELNSSNASDVKNQASKLARLFSARAEAVRRLASSSEVILSIRGKVDDINVSVSIPNELFVFASSAEIQIDFAMHVFGPSLDELGV